MKLVLVLVFIAFATAGANGQTSKQGSVKDGVLKVLRTYDDAWNKKDSATVNKILAPNYMYFSSEGGITKRKAALDFLVSPKYKLTFAERSEIEAYPSGDVVIVSSRWKGKGTYEKGIIDDDQRCGLVFVRQNRVWKLLSEHCALF